MFILKPDNTYDWPVRVQVPREGAFQEQQFTAIFKVMPHERIQEMVNANKVDLDFLREVVVGWRQVKAEDQTEIPFSPEARDRLLGIPYVVRALFNAFAESASGRAFEKNLPAPGGTGRPLAH